MTESEGVLRSADKGETWERMNVPIDPDRQANMIGAESGVVIVCASAGSRVLFMSSDSGATWNDLNEQSGFPQMSGCRSLVSSGSSLFLGSERTGSYGGIVRSADSGKTWQRVNDGQSMNGIYALGTVDTVLVAGRVERSADEGCIFRSLDRGVTWVKSQSGLPQSCLKRVNAFGTCGKQLFAAVHEFTLPSYIADRNYIYRSDDCGATWQRCEQGLRVPDGNCFLTLPGHLMLAVKCDGIYAIAENDSVWRPVNSGLNCMPISALCSTGGRILCSSFFHYIFEYTTQGGWKELPADVLYDTYIAAGGNTVAIASRNGVRISKDNGSTWTMTDTTGVTAGFKGAIPSFWGRPLSVHEGYAFCAKWDGIYRTRTSDAKTEHVFANTVNTVSNEDWYFFAGCKEAIVAGFAGKLLVSNDTGKTWSERTGVCDYPTAACFPDPGSTSRILVAEYNLGVYRSGDGGKTWSRPVSQLPRLNVFASWKGVLFAGTKGLGMQISRDTGATWADFNTGLGYIRFITDLLITDTLLYAGTDGAGVWVCNLKEFGSATTGAGHLSVKGSALSPSWKLAVSVDSKNRIHTKIPIRCFDLRGKRLSNNLTANGMKCIGPISKVIHDPK
jgi:photosystem II stability/assembly factor-like uncharacterized protein